jgi:lysylphosphatidylglycerol synthetase-like protein (DUF2156 family)
MAYIFALILLIVALIFGLSSISQSYASAKQAQAVIEASRAAQIASAGNLVSLVSVALVIMAVLVAVVVIAWFVLQVKSQPKRRWMAGSNEDREEVSSPQFNAMLPVLFSMMMYQMIQSQQEQHQQQTEQLWMMNEAAHDMEVATFSDNSTWDF